MKKNNYENFISMYLDSQNVSKFNNTGILINQNVLNYILNNISFEPETL